MTILTNITSDKKDLIKANNSVTGFKEKLGEDILMTGVLIYEKEEIDTKTGEIEKKVVCAIKDSNGDFITSVSPTVKNSLDMIVESYTEEEIKAGLPITIKSKRSNAGRDFFYVDLI